MNIRASISIYTFNNTTVYIESKRELRKIWFGWNWIFFNTIQKKLIQLTRPLENINKFYCCRALPEFIALRNKAISVLINIKYSNILLWIRRKLTHKHSESFLCFSPSLFNKNTLNNSENSQISGCETDVSMFLFNDHFFVLTTGNFCSLMPSSIHQT